ncbi:MAG: response regulator, partial [Pirellulaceae bacterium]|nr:response regulator [Pirellulaceae bacterium]
MPDHPMQDSAKPSGSRASPPRQSRWTRHFFSSILRQQMLFVAGAVVLTGGTLVLASYWFARPMLEQQIRDHLQTVAVARSERMEEFGRLQFERIGLVASRTQLRALLSKSALEFGDEDRRDLHKILEDVRASTAGFRAVWATDLQGTVRASTDPELLSANFAQDPDFLRGRQETHLGLPYDSGAGYEAVLAGPASRDDQLVGVVMARIDATALHNLFTSRLQLGDTGVVLVARREGELVRFLLPPRHWPHYTLPAANEPELAAVVNAPPGRGDFRFRDRQVLGIHLPVQYPPGDDSWQLIVIREASDAYKPVVQLHRLLLGLSVVLVVAGLSLSYLVARHFTDPILRMADAATQIAAGQVGTQVQVESQDEIGRLAEALNDMSRRLAQTHETLEQSVAARTAELASANRELGLARQVAEEASLAKSGFLASMSHEIRTPLSALLGMTQLVLDSPLNDQQRDYLQTVRESGNALLAVINDILDFSKIEAGKMELETAPFDLHELLADTLKLLAYRAHGKGLELHCRIEPGTPRNVAGDAGRLRQVLLNLVANAVKFTERGEIVVAARACDSTGRELRVEIEVSDTGIGIPVERQRAIFAAFEQADSSVARQFGGTGLGLAIATRLVQRMGGEIRLESQPGRGSRFTFSVLLQRADAPAGDGQTTGPPETHQSAERASQPLVPLRVLLAEDSAVNQRLVVVWLEAAGHRVTAVSLGQLAVERAGRETYDVILMDVQLPDIDGLEATRQIRAAEQRTQRRVPIVALTAHAVTGFRQQCLEAGMDEYVTKPILLPELIAAIRRVVPQPAAAPGGQAAE